MNQENIETRLQSIEQKLDVFERSVPSADCIAKEIGEALKKTLPGTEKNTYDS